MLICSLSQLLAFVRLGSLRLWGTVARSAVEPLTPALWLFCSLHFHTCISPCSSTRSASLMRRARCGRYSMRALSQLLSVTTDSLQAGPTLSSRRASESVSSAATKHFWLALPPCAHQANALNSLQIGDIQTVTLHAATLPCRAMLCCAAAIHKCVGSELNLFLPRRSMTTKHDVLCRRCSATSAMDR